MAQLSWVTTSGSLGTIAQGLYFTIPVVATTNTVGKTIFYKKIAGDLPNGIECEISGTVNGVPPVPTDPALIGFDVTSKFTVRAYTTANNQSSGTIDGVADRTFTITVAGQTNPEWVTPAGMIYNNEGDEFFTTELLTGDQAIQLEFTTNSNAPASTTIISGSLPPGLTLSPTGLISGYIGFNPLITVEGGFSRDLQGFDEYPFDFPSRSTEFVYDFTVKLTSGNASVLRTFSMFVWSNSTFVASTTRITDDTTLLRASISSEIVPLLLNPVGSIGTERSDNFYAYQFIGTDFVGNKMGYQGTDIPSFLTLDSETGWLYGTLPNIGLTSQTYNFSVQVYQYNDPLVISQPFDYSLTIAGNIDTEITWLTPSDLGTLNNGDISTLYVEAVANSGVVLNYALAAGADSSLPPGLQLLPSGHIVGRASFNVFALDGFVIDGEFVPETTFDNGTTTFDLVYTFTVNLTSVDGFIDVDKEFSIRINRKYDKPYNNLYIKCMPPLDDRALINSLLTNANVFPPDLIYRSDDPNFGLSNGVYYNHAFGLNADTLDAYIQSLEINHYLKNLQLGEIKTAQALDDLENVLYEVVYAEIVDNLVNNDNQSVDKAVVLAYPIEPNTPNQTDVVYPNSLENMRDQVIDVVGQESNVLPRWMLTKQTNGQVLGFTPAWVIAYTVPGASGQIAYNIQQYIGTQLNLIDFHADRYELDNSETVLWDRQAQQWYPENYYVEIDDTNRGTGFAVGDIVVIPGDTIGGASPINDCNIIVTTVDSSGRILTFTNTGTPNLLAVNTSYFTVAGTTTAGTGIGSRWDVYIAEGLTYQYGPDRYNKYLMFPRRAIVGESVSSTNWTNSQNNTVNWVNNSNIPVTWWNDDI